MEHAITLEAITEDNVEEIMDLELHPRQAGHLASNACSIARMGYYTNFVGRALCLGGKPAGFVLYAMQPDETAPEALAIYRFMIDKARQGKGIGTRALACLIRQLTDELAGASRITICYHSDNPALRAYYARFGFVETGIDPDAFGEDGSGPGDNIAEIRLR